MFFPTSKRVAPSSKTLSTRTPGGTFTAQPAATSPEAARSEISDSSRWTDSSRWSRDTHWPSMADPSTENPTPVILAAVTTSIPTSISMATTIATSRSQGPSIASNSRQQPAPRTKPKKLVRYQTAGKPPHPSE